MYTENLHQLVNKRSNGESRCVTGPHSGRDYLFLLSATAWAVFNLFPGPTVAQVNSDQVTAPQPLPKLSQHTSHLYDHGEWSHDGKKIVFMMHQLEESNTTTIWLHDLSTGESKPLTYPDAVGCFDAMPTWSPDDRQVAFGSYRGGDNN